MESFQRGATVSAINVLFRAAAIPSSNEHERTHMSAAPDSGGTEQGAEMGGAGALARTSSLFETCDGRRSSGVEFDLT